MKDTHRKLSVFDHYVAQCAIAHQRAVRAARSGTGRETSELTEALIRKMHRLSDVVATLGAAAVFDAPAQEFGIEEAARLFDVER